MLANTDSLTENEQWVGKKYLLAFLFSSVHLATLPTLKNIFKKGEKNGNKEENFLFLFSTQWDSVRHHFVSAPSRFNIALPLISPTKNDSKCFLRPITKEAECRLKEYFDFNMLN